MPRAILRRIMPVNRKIRPIVSRRSRMARLQIPPRRVICRTFFVWPRRVSGEHLVTWQEGTLFEEGKMMKTLVKPTRDKEFSKTTRRVMFVF
ncbi:hypothetical protein KL86DPRO_40051 [uncultured delta proteobacterium]|uniref:Uncharacterized protein n=1 Tax=uncultured delta proteobacterium TaxID=34034 RepID=A0A212K9C0_9DELT|nr:hypothetical protein KL86DPRO_40051 [uncultured delta proteobacterium]